MIQASRSSHEQRDLDLGGGQPTVVAAEPLVETGRQDHLVFGWDEEVVSHSLEGVDRGVGADQADGVDECAAGVISQGFDQ